MSNLRVVALTVKISERFVDMALQVLPLLVEIRPVSAMPQSVVPVCELLTVVRM